MSAPPFFSSITLAADLDTLGYPDSQHPSSIHPSHPARLQTLHFLAHQISPDTPPRDSLPRTLAQFYNLHGLHTHPPTSSGHYIPLTVPTDKPRDRNLANAFLRSAIDLAMACTRRRQMGLDALQPSHGELWTQEDLENDTILAGLIDQREQLFPSSIGIFGRMEGKKRKILAAKKGPGLNARDHARKIPDSGKINAKGKERDKTHVYSKEEIVDLIRTMNRESHDFERNKVEPENEKGKQGEPNTLQQVEPLNADLVEKISTECQALEGLVRQFEHVVGQAMQETGEEMGLRDRDDEKQVNKAAEECERLRGEVRRVFEIAGRMRTAMGKVHRGWREIEAFRYGQVMRRVTEEKERVKAQLSAWDGSEQP